ncbi:hypothetical protein ACWD3Z_36705 [Streptomyces sp. NPDC002740]
MRSDRPLQALRNIAAELQRLSRVPAVADWIVAYRTPVTATATATAGGRT